MKLTPLCMLAALRIPALTDTFSDPLDLASMTVEAAPGIVTLACNTPHGLPEGDKIGISVTDAFAPNPVTAWSEVVVPAAPVKAGDIVLTMAYPHTLSVSPDTTKYIAWDAFARIRGTGVIGLDGTPELIAVPDQLTIIVRPTGAITLPGSLPGTAVLLERLERNLVGWKTATVVDETTLTFNTPAAITRAYTVTDPKAVTNIRVWGAIDLQSALSHFTRNSEAENALDGLKLDKGYMFVAPRRDIRLSRDRTSSSNATTEIQPGAFVRQTLMDGFEIYVMLPAERYGGGVGCVDRCHGEVFTAVLQTFNGLKLPFKELASSANPTISMLSRHQCAGYNHANYIHNYSFEANATLTAGDCAPAILVPDLAGLDDAIQHGTDLPDALTPQGTVPISAIIFDPGIFQKGKPQPLLATVPVDIDLTGGTTTP